MRPLRACTCRLPPYGWSSINAGAAIKRRMVSKVVRADAGHLACCVRDDHHGLKGSQNRAVDIWASDCLNTESLGLLSAGINPFTLPHQTGQIVFHRARIRIIRARQVALFKSVNKDQIWIRAAAALTKHWRRAGSVQQGCRGVSHWWSWDTGQDVLPAAAAVLKSTGETEG